MKDFIKLLFTLLNQCASSLALIIHIKIQQALKGNDANNRDDIAADFKMFKQVTRKEK